MGIDGFDRQMARSSRASRWIGGASLEEEGVAGVADSDRFGRGGQRELVVGAAVTEDLPTVPTVVLSSRDGELLLTQLAVAGLLVLQPHLTPLKQHSDSQFLPPFT